jgi:SAM-dependent methyltransferase
VFTKIVDNRVDSSLATRLRRKRFEFFLAQINKLTPPYTILDIGGTLNFWSTMKFFPTSDIHIILMNLTSEISIEPGVEMVIGDGRILPFDDQSIDIVFSNSVIEHVGDFDEQKRMADEIIRVGRRYFVQTPNRYFPIEPHFLVPFFQFFPYSFRAWMLTRSRLGWMPKASNYTTAMNEVRGVRLLSKHEVTGLFYNARLYQEIVFGITKSFVLYSGWD